MGCKWNVGGKHVVNLEFPFILIECDNIMRCLNDMEVFSQFPFPELTADEILNMKVEKTYQFKPFEEVLVRSNFDALWIPRHFAKVSDEMFITTSGAIFSQCVPYKGNEHLCDTTENHK